MEHWKTSIGVALAAVVALPMAACVHHETQLVPASGVAQVGRTPLVTIDGVQLRANGDVRGALGEVRDGVTPVELSVYNSSDHALRIRYDQFWIVDESGRRYAALPPFHIVDGRVVSEALEPLFVSVRFAVAPALSGLYPGMAVTSFDMKQAEESGYHNRYYPYWLTSGGGLPTKDMLRSALPEGTISIGGRVDGYLYFEAVPTTARVQLRMQLVDAADNETFATASVPFNR